MDNFEPNTSDSGQYLFSYYLVSICSQAFKLRRRNVLKESEWRSYVVLMKNCSQRGTIREVWKRIEEDRWLDPTFQEFINTEIVQHKP
jgi:sarcosine oxidase delta subunit